jgi:tRNA(fMet)-specific endonuclease VapC
MAEYLLDTNHLSPLVTLEHPLREQVLLRMQAGDTFSIPTPALNEFLFGISILPRAKQNLVEWERFKYQFNYYAIDRVSAERSATLRVSLRKRGLQLEALDSLIAIIALRYDLVLLTTDKDFYAIPNLRYESWRTS